jgi:protein-S-isoprenylcysteine O-methyltransferase Ste14
MGANEILATYIYSIMGYFRILFPIEEKIFGQTYMNYKHRVPSIVPNLFYKKKINEK